MSELLAQISINDAPGAAGVEVGIVNLTAGQALNLYASGYDLDGNFRSAQSVNWASTGTLEPILVFGSSLTFTPSVAPTSGTITATLDTLNDATGLISVSEGTLANIIIRTGPAGGGVEFTTSLITADQSVSLYAAGYDANNNYVSEVTATWSSTGSLDQIGATGTSFTFNPVKAPASGTIEARNGDHFDNTGIIEVTVGALAGIRINTAVGAGGLEFLNYDMNADQSVNLHSAGYDADGNFRSMVSSTWSNTGNLDIINLIGSSITFNPVKAPATGTIRASFSGFLDDTGPITISVGALNYISINDQPGIDGVAVGNVTITVDDMLSLYASAYDADGNYRSGVNASWSTTGGLDSQTGLGDNFIFNPETAPTSGQIQAFFSGRSDNTGIITVQEGGLSSIRIRTAANGQGDIFTTYDMTADQTVTLYAAAYDGGGNYLFDVEVDWLTTGTLNTVSFRGSSFTFNPTTAPTSGTITATLGQLEEETGLIRVSPGLPVIIVDPTTFNDERTTVAGSGLLLRVRIEDQYGNPVEGVPVAFEPASLMSDPAVETDVIGEAKTVYATPRDRDQSIVEVTADGLDLFFLTVNGIRYIEGSLSPRVVARNQAYAFSIQVSNPGSIPVPISPSATNLSFADQTGHTYSAVLQTPSTLPANNNSISLQFLSEEIDANFSGGKYSPQIQTGWANHFLRDERYSLYRFR